MPVPKRRRSKSQKRMRRAVWKFDVPNMSACKNCGTMVLPHFACSGCGYYGGKQVIELSKKKDKQDKKDS